MGARILVADDSVAIQKVVELTFSKEDFVLTQARSGEEAIRKARETRPDLVLLDLVMPDMNGYDVCAALRTEPVLRSVPIILLAGTFESYDQQRGTQAGATDFVTKPFESQVLIGKVKQLLFARSMEAEGASAAATRLPGSVTVKISSAAAANAALRVSDDTPPAPPTAPPQEELWQLLRDSPEPAPADAPREDSTALGGPPAEPEGPALDLGALDIERLPSEIPSAADAMEVLPLPESLSLDDLLAAGPDRPSAPPTRETAQEGPAPSEPVFELSAAEAPPLPMVEAGKDEPPSVSVDDLLRPAVGDAAAADTLTLLPEFDLGAFPDAGAPGAADSESARPTFPQAQAPPAEPESELPLQEADEPRWAAAGVESAGFGGMSEFLPPSQAGAGSSDLADALGRERLGAEAPAVAPPAPVEDLVMEPTTVLTPVGPQADEPAKDTPVSFSASEMTAMRETVTERVAQDLKRELSEKLLDRFEKIVWEVVPDLAEILITKEIERIRRLAEEEKS